MTLEELRASLKALDMALGRLEHRTGRNELADLHDAVADISEYLLKQHARLDRFASDLAKVKIALRTKS